MLIGNLTNCHYQQNWAVRASNACAAPTSHARGSIQEFNEDVTATLFIFQ